MSKNKINDLIFKSLTMSQLSKVPVLLMSAPGLGKTTSVEIWAKKMGYKLQVLRGSSSSETEILGYDVVDHEMTKIEKTTVHLRPHWFTTLLKNEALGIKTLLFLDEITTAPEHVQAALLQLIFDRKVKDEKIPDSTLIVSAGNYASSLGGSFKLIPPLMNRFSIINIIPNNDDMGAFLSKYEGSISETSKFEDEGWKAKLAEALIDDRDASQFGDNLPKAGEFMERQIKNVIESLTKDGKYNPKIAELESIYSDVTSLDDPTLYGFVSGRTLGYFRDCSLTLVDRFGSNIVREPIFKEMTKGLVGLSLSIEGKKLDITKNDVSSSFLAAIERAISDTKKLANGDLIEINKIINEFISKCKTSVSSKTTNEDFYKLVNLESLINQFKSINSVDIRDIQRPIEPTKVTELFDSLSKLGDKLGGKAFSLGFPNNSPVTDENFWLERKENLVELILEYNKHSQAIEALCNLVSDPTRDYSDEVKKKATMEYQKLLKRDQSPSSISNFIKATLIEQHSMARWGKSPDKFSKEMVEMAQSFPQIRKVNLRK